MKKAKNSATFGEVLGEFMSGLHYEDLPMDVTCHLKLHLIDTLGVGLAFSGTPLARSLVDMAASAAERKSCSVLGESLRTSERTAALVNGSIMHGLDFDDVHVESITHPSAVVLPSVLALAEAEHVDGATAIAALAAGIEVCARVGLAGGGGMARKGIPPMSVCGALGAAAAAGRILGLSGDAIASAIGIAGSLAAGSHEWTTSDSNFKFVTAGTAASAGILAARMAQRGFVGSRSAIEGRKGLLNAFAGPDGYNLQMITGDLGRLWACADLAFKPYPSCRGTQPYVECALELHDKLVGSLESIESVTVRVGTVVGRSLCEPHDLKRDPSSSYNAKFSIPYTVALALLEGSVRLEHFDSRWQETHPIVSSLARCVTHIVEPAFDLGTAAHAHVSVRMSDGRDWVATTTADDDTSGSATMRAKVIAKFRDCTRERISAERQDDMIERILRLNDETDLSYIIPDLMSVPS